jgi:hypothetical protein
MVIRTMVVASAPVAQIIKSSERVCITGRGLRVQFGNAKATVTRVRQRTMSRPRRARATRRSLDLVAEELGERSGPWARWSSPAARLARAIATPRCPAMDLLVLFAVLVVLTAAVLVMNWVVRRRDVLHRLDVECDRS